MAEPRNIFDFTRAERLDFDARALAIAAASGGELDDRVLAWATRCAGWDYDDAAGPGGLSRAATLYDLWGRVLTTLWIDKTALLPEPPPAAGPAPGWRPVEAPWASLWAPASYIGGEPESVGPAALGALQARGPDWLEWGNEWLSPATASYTMTRGMNAALLFLAETGAASLDQAGYAILMRQQLDAAHAGITLEWRTNDLAQRIQAHGARVESVAYGTVTGRPGSRIVSESQTGHRLGPPRLYNVNYTFMAAPATCSLMFTLPSADGGRLGEADRIAATFAFRG